jgi:hypothetical protein
VLVLALSLSLRRHINHHLCFGLHHLRVPDSRMLSSLSSLSNMSSLGSLGSLCSGREGEFLCAAVFKGGYVFGCDG